MYEALVARVRYHIQKANFMGLKEAESTLLLAEAADAIEELIAEATDAIEELTGFIQEAERDRDEYRERLDKANDAIEELQRRVPKAPHGRLIDADEMKESIRKQTAFLRLIGGEFAEIAETLEKGFLQEIDNAPTVIEAEEVET